jgi:hypothetical protein
VAVRSASEHPVTDNDTKVYSALLAAVIALIVAVLNSVFAWRNQRDAARNQQDLEVLKTELTATSAERNARRDYEYEARKRLYQQYEPLRFRLIESSDSAMAQITSLAERAREGDLAPSGWLSRDSYYLKATIYQLLQPCAIYKLMEQRLTLIDLQLDQVLYAHYVLGKAIYTAYTDDFLFAALSGFEYTPYVPDWRERRMEDPRVFRRQGFPRGRLDNALESLIYQDNVTSFARFEKELETVEENDVSGGLGTARDVFFEFHPGTRPVLWRILCAQYFLYKCIRDMQHRRPGTSADVANMLASSSADAGERFDWRRSPGEMDDAAVLSEPARVAHDYFRRRVIGSLQMPPG